MEKKANSLSRRIIPMLWGISFIFLFLFSMYKSREVEILEKCIDIKQRTIEKYIERDSLIRVYIGVDSFGSPTYAITDKD